MAEIIVYLYWIFNDLDFSQSGKLWMQMFKTDRLYLEDLCNMIFLSYFALCLTKIRLTCFQIYFVIRNLQLILHWNRRFKIRKKENCFFTMMLNSICDWFLLSESHFGKEKFIRMLIFFFFGLLKKMKSFLLTQRLKKFEFISSEIIDTNYFTFITYIFFFLSIKQRFWNLYQKKSHGIVWKECYSNTDLGSYIYRFPWRSLVDKKKEKVFKKRKKDHLKKKEMFQSDILKLKMVNLVCIYFFELLCFPN